MGSHLTESDDALMWMRSELNGDNFGCITFKESLVGGPPYFGDIESCPLGFGNDLLLFIYCLHAFHIIVLACFDVS